MNNKVKFLRGTSNEYAVAEKDSDTIYFTTDDGKLYIGDKEVSGSDITIDDTLSDTSENPVQNKVVNAALNEKASKDTMTGATSSADGTSGLVPAPTIGENNKFLRGDGTWQTVGGVGGVTGYYVNNGKTRTETFTTSGTWVVPEGVTKVDIFLVGGGGGGVGNYSSGTIGGGGGGGYTQFVKDYMVTPGKTINYIVGAGGSGGSTTASAGGATSFGISVNGGSGAGSDPDYKGGDGGSGGSSYRNYTNLSGTNGGNGAGGMQSSRTITGGKGQGFPTMDPYTGTVYSAGGGLRSPGKYGDGGQAGSSGYSGVIKIYY